MDTHCDETALVALTMFPLCVTRTVYVPLVGAETKTCSTLSTELSPVVAAAAGFAGFKTQGKFVTPLGLITRKSRSFTKTWFVGSSVKGCSGPPGSVQQIET